jgi:cytoskeletal protein RodZ
VIDSSGASGGQHRPRRGLRLGDSRAPVTTVVVLAAATVAVVAGLVILRSMTDQAAGSDELASDVATTTVSAAPESTSDVTASTTTTTTTTTTTIAPRASKSDAVIVVANASGVDRSATAMTAELEADGYTTASVANATGPRLERSIIYYLDEDPASLAVARLLAEQIPTARTVPMPEPPPLDRPLDGATVALLLGTDAAGRPLSELQTG